MPMTHMDTAATAVKIISFVRTFKFANTVPHPFFRKPGRSSPPLYIYVFLGLPLCLILRQDYLPDVHKFMRRTWMAR